MNAVVAHQKTALLDVETWRTDGSCMCLPILKLKTSKDDFMASKTDPISVTSPEE